MKTKKCALVFYYMGDTVDVYRIPILEAKKYEKTLRACQNKYINGDEITPAMEKLSALLAEEEKHVPKGKFKKYAAKWRKYKISLESPITNGIVTVYFSGFLP